MNRPLLMSIAAVERDTGLSKDTLRIWEKRYGFPLPKRDAQGERCYPMDQVERLRVIKRLLDVGHRPGRIVHLPMDDLGVLAGRSADAQGLQGVKPRRRPAATQPAPPQPPTLSPRWPLTAPPSAARGQRLPARSPAPLCAQVHAQVPPQTNTAAIPPLASAPAPTAHPAPADGALTPPTDWAGQALACVQAHDPWALRHLLGQAQAALGLPGYIGTLVVPLLHALGEGWLRGHVQIAQEHWVSHLLQQSLHSAIHALPPPSPLAGPRVLLSTFPGEPHSLGLLMVEAWLGLLQVPTVNLGPQTPLWDLVQAASHYRMDVVALSFTTSAPTSLVQDTLAECRAKLPPHIALWAGGQHPLLQRKPPEGVQVLSDLASLRLAVTRWRGASTP